jgi:hypothetical protein
MVPTEKILQTARERNANLIGLSGLITPSLDEMVHVAKEMERQKMGIPLLIGGATTSKAHTAVKIAPGYSEPVVHVLDASRAVSVVGNLISSQLRPAFVENVRSEYEKLRAQHGEKKGKALLSIEEARARKFKVEWKASDIAKPEFMGVRGLASDAGPSPRTLSPSDGEREKMILKRGTMVKRLVRRKILELLIPTGERVFNCRLFFAHRERPQRQEMAAWTGANPELEMMRAKTFAPLNQAVGIDEEFDRFVLDCPGDEDATGCIAARIDDRSLAQENFFGGSEFLVFGTELCFTQRHWHDLTPSVN